MRERKHIRSKVWDYNSIGYYFITINTKDYRNHFGMILNNNIDLSETGKIAHQCWMELPYHFRHILIDKFIIMPNHFHGIIKILSFDGLDMQTERFNAKLNGLKLQSNEWDMQTERFNAKLNGLKLQSNEWDMQTERFNAKLNGLKLQSNEWDMQTERFNVYGTGMPVPYDKTILPYDKTNPQYKKLPIIIGSYKSAVSKLAHKKGYGNFGWHKSYYDHIVRNEKDLNRIRKYITNNPSNWNKN